MKLLFLLAFFASAVLAKDTYSGTCYYDPFKLINLQNNTVYETGYSPRAMTSAERNQMMMYGNQWAQYGIQSTLHCEYSETMRSLLLVFLLLAAASAKTTYSGTCFYNNNTVYETGNSPRPMTAAERNQMITYGSEWSQYGAQVRFNSPWGHFLFFIRNVPALIFFLFHLLTAAAAMNVYSGTCRYDWAYVYETGYDPRPLTANEINQLKQYGAEWEQYGIQ
ncbi:hypothetical protein PENTCL1PPCAC_2653, partial [Pristionchus entomophagus]